MTDKCLKMYVINIGEENRSQQNSMHIIRLNSMQQQFDQVEANDANGGREAIIRCSREPTGGWRR
jgi:hypothetical protein